MNEPAHHFIDWFRQSSPYIHAHRGRTFVLAIGGEMVASPGFASWIHDIALLQALGVRLVLVHGARPQIEARLARDGAAMEVVNGLRVTDAAALACVKEAAGAVRLEIEALLSMGLANSPMAGACIRVTSGNFVTARPLGVVDGVDYCHTGEVRRIDVDAIGHQLDAGAVVLLSPVGLSPTGEIFNLEADEVAAATAAALKADKLLRVVQGEVLLDEHGEPVLELALGDAERLIGRVGEMMSRPLAAVCRACRLGVPRAHLIPGDIDGALLRELFTRDGVGTLISAEPYEDMRPATLGDIGGILELIEPLEQAGVLVRRSREALEMEIEQFSVIARDGMVIACAALYAYAESGMGELACVAVHADYRASGRGDRLLGMIERQAKAQGLERLFVLTTRTAHWFRERGFEPAETDNLPMAKQKLYNYQRASKVFIKGL